MNSSLPMLGLVFTLVACDPVTSVTLSGTVYDAPYAQGSTVSGLDVGARCVDLEPCAQTQTAADGSFSVTVPPAQELFLEFSGDEHETTLFAGEVYLEDLQAWDGAFWVEDSQDRQDLVDTFGDCASADGATGDDGGIVEGEARLFTTDASYADLELVTNAGITAYDESGLSFDACYLDDDGQPADEGTTVTGASGRFAFFGLPAGQITLVVLCGDLDQPSGAVCDISRSFTYHVFMTDDGMAPFYPMLLE